MAENLPAYTGASCDWYNVPCHLSSFASWLAKFLEWLPAKAFERLMSALASGVEAIPVPGFFSTASTGLASIPSSVMFFVQFAEIPAGIAMVLSAYGLRFALRRIPFVG